MIFKREGTKARRRFLFVIARSVATKQSLHCHPEGAQRLKDLKFVKEILRFAQDDNNKGVIPAKAGIHSAISRQAAKWIPAYAGMTMGFCKEESVG